MKTFLKQFLKIYLKFFAKLSLFIHRPTIIAITGSTNKTFAKNYIKEILEKNNISVRVNPKNFNTEIGLPLSVLYLPSGYNSYKKWFPVILNAPLVIFKKFPKYLVLELGVSNSGDMKYLLSIIRPKITVITDISQRYLEAFSDMDHLVDEYMYLAKNTKSNDYLILNNDNPRIKKISKNIKANIFTYSVKAESKYRATNIKKAEEGLSFNFKGKSISIKRYGKHHIYSYLISRIIKDII